MLALPAAANQHGLELKSDRPDHCSRGRRADTDGRERVPVRSELCLTVVCVEEIGDVKLDLPVTSLIEGSQIDLRPSRVLRSVLFRDEHIADREHAATNAKLPLRELPFIKREHIEVVPRYTSDAVSLLEETAEAAGAARGDCAVYVRIAALQAPGIGNLPGDFKLETLGLNFANESLSRGV